MWVLSCMPMPWKPVSLAPTESVKTVFGNASIQRSLTGGLKIAALLETANRLEPCTAYPWPPSLELLDQRPRHGVTGHEDQLDLVALDDLPGRWGSNFGSRIVEVPGEQVHQQAGLGATVHHRAEREVTMRVACLFGLVGLLQRSPV